MPSAPYYGPVIPPRAEKFFVRWVNYDAPHHRPLARREPFDSHPEALAWARRELGFTRWDGAEIVRVEERQVEIVRSRRNKP